MDALYWIKGWIEYLFSALFYRRTEHPSIDIPLQEFFLPGGSVKLGGKSVILKPPESFVAYKEEFEEEVVYELELGRYLFNVQLVEDLPERMIAQLRDIIGNNPINRNFQGAWRLYQYSNLDEIASMLDNQLRANFLWRMVLEAFHIIRPNDSYRNDRVALSKDRRVVIHNRIQSGPETKILTEVMGPYVADAYICKLIEMASEDRDSDFEEKFPEKLVGPEAILARVIPISTLPGKYIAADSSFNIVKLSISR
jgi:hypothetical protein